MAGVKQGKDGVSGVGDGIGFLGRMPEGTTGGGYVVDNEVTSVGKWRQERKWKRVGENFFLRRGMRVGGGVIVNGDGGLVDGCVRERGGGIGGRGNSCTCVATGRGMEASTTSMGGSGNISAA